MATDPGFIGGSSQEQKADIDNTRFRKRQGSAAKLHFSTPQHGTIPYPRSLSSGTLEAKATCPVFKPGVWKPNQCQDCFQPKSAHREGTYSAATQTTTEILEEVERERTIAKTAAALPRRRARGSHTSQNSTSEAERPPFHGLNESGIVGVTTTSTPIKDSPHATAPAEDNGNNGRVGGTALPATLSMTSLAPPSMTSFTSTMTSSTVTSAITPSVTPSATSYMPSPTILSLTPAPACEHFNPGTFKRSQCRDCFQPESTHYETADPTCDVWQERALPAHPNKTKHVCGQQERMTQTHADHPCPVQQETIPTKPFGPKHNNNDEAQPSDQSRTGQACPKFSPGRWRANVYQQCFQPRSAHIDRDDQPIATAQAESSMQMLSVCMTEENLDDILDTHNSRDNTDSSLLHPSSAKPNSVTTSTKATNNLYAPAEKKDNLNSMSSTPPQCSNNDLNAMRGVIHDTPTLHLSSGVHVAEELASFSSMEHVSLWQTATTSVAALCMCNECEQSNAVCYCKECDLAFCTSCSRSTHSVGKLQLHTIEYLALDSTCTAAPCRNCNEQPAVADCSKCTGHFCTSCCNAKLEDISLVIAASTRISQADVQCDGCEEAAADWSCDNCGMDFCKSCWQQEHAGSDDLQSHKPSEIQQIEAGDSFDTQARYSSMSGSGKSEIFCDECGDVTAESYCSKCGMNFCVSCWKAQHLGGQLLTHEAQPLHLAAEPLGESLVCEQCGQTIADAGRYCKDCGITFCSSNWQSVHATTSLPNHEPLATPQEAMGDWFNSQEFDDAAQLPTSLVDNSTLCYECSDKPAVDHCGKCGLNYCVSCWQTVHSGGKLMTHKAVPLKAKHKSSDSENYLLCGECEKATADPDMYCTACGIAFCKSCWQNAHATANLQHHTASSITEKAVIDNRLVDCHAFSPTDPIKSFHKVCDECSHTIADRYCDTCGLNFCGTCWGTVHINERLSTHTAIPLTNDQTSLQGLLKLCDECQQSPVVYYCSCCTEAFCANCWDEVHACGKLRSHIAMLILPNSNPNLPPPPCQKCNVATAKNYCHTCQLAFCDGCWQDRHAPGTVEDHIPVALDVALYCGRCELVQATVTCNDCGMFFCDACDAHLHHASSRGHHLRLSVLAHSAPEHRPKPDTRGQICQRCQRATATTCCLQCQHIYCAPCEAAEHSGQPIGSHQRVHLGALLGMMQRMNVLLGELASETTQDSEVMCSVRDTTIITRLTRITDQAARTVLEGDVTADQFQTMAFHIIPLMTVSHEQQEMISLTPTVLVRGENVRKLVEMYSNDRCVKLDFNHLNHIAIKTIGLFGNTTGLQKWLIEHNIIDENTLAGMTEPGLYCISSGSQLQFIVLQTTRDALTRLSRKNITCNMLRYLLELCGKVLVFYCEDDVDMFHDNPFEHSESKHDRTQMMTLAFEQREEEDVEVHAGFSVKLHPDLLTSNPLFGSIALTYSWYYRAMHICQEIRPCKDSGLKQYTADELQDFMQQSADHFCITFDESISLDERCWLLSTIFPDKIADLEEKMADLDHKFTKEQEDAVASRNHDNMLEKAITAHIEKSCPIAKFFFDDFLDQAMDRLQKSIAGCPVCCEFFTAPKQLPCGHAVCEDCLMDCMQPNDDDGSGGWAITSTQTSCPVCQQTHSVPAGELPDATVDVEESLTSVRQQSGPTAGKKDNGMFLHCVLCCQLMDKPKQLPCGDIVCLECLMNKVQRADVDDAAAIICPVCNRKQFFITSRLRDARVLDHKLLSFSGKNLDPVKKQCQEDEEAIAYVNEYLQSEEKGPFRHSFKQRHAKQMDRLLAEQTNNLQVMERAYVVFSLAISQSLHFEEDPEAINDESIPAVELQRQFQRLSKFVALASSDGMSSVDNFITENIAYFSWSSKRKKFKDMEESHRQSILEQPFNAGMPDVFRAANCQKVACELRRQMKRLLRGNRRWCLRDDEVAGRYIEQLDSLAVAKEVLKRETVCELEDHLRAGSDVDFRVIVQVELPQNGSSSCQMHYREERILGHVHQLFPFIPMRDDAESAMCENSIGSALQPHITRSLYNLPIAHGTQQLLKLYVLNVKGGKLLAFIKEKDSAGVQVYLCPVADYRQQTDLSRYRLSLKRGDITMIDVDEDTRWAALYAVDLKCVDLFRFEEDWERWRKWCEIDLTAQRPIGNLVLSYMMLVPQQQRLCLIDKHNTCRLYDIQHKEMTDKTLDLQSHPSAAMVSLDGAFLFAFQVESVLRFDWSWYAEDATADYVCEPSDRESSESSHNVFSEDSSGGRLVMQIYSLDSGNHLKQVDLDKSLFPPSSLPSLRFVMLGQQMHLVALNAHQESLVSLFVIPKSAKSMLFMKSVQKSNVSLEDQSRHQANYLDYLYHVFDKFAVDDCLKTTSLQLNLMCVWDLSDDRINSQLSKGELCCRYLDIILCSVEYNTKKPMTQISVSPKVEIVSLSRSCLASVGHDIPNSRLSEWVQQLIAMVPIQLCRAEQDQLTLFSDGVKSCLATKELEIKKLQEVIQLGLYEDILDWWTGPVKIVSSMGKQSTGKSYMLNHLTGSLFDISGDRCTDGAWLTVRFSGDCLYVVMDFEGLGSFERSKREDMLLSVLNAGISGLTLFRVEYRLDQDIRDMLTGFCDGVDLVKGGEDLFRGWFYINIKDVPQRDIEDIQRHFKQKLQQICGEDPENNFMARMYRSQLMIQAFPELGKEEFYAEMMRIITDVLKTDKVPQFASGQEFKNSLKFLLAKLHRQEWSKMEHSKVLINVKRLQQIVGHVIEFGLQLNDNNEEEPLTEPSGELVADQRLQMPFLQTADQLLDAGLQFPPQQADKETILVHRMFEFFIRSCGGRDTALLRQWTTNFQTLVEGVFKRRSSRVHHWIQSQVKAFASEPEAKKLLENVDQQVALVCGKVRTICQLRCSQCMYLCLLLRHHKGDHDCLGDHRCPHACEFCQYESLHRPANAVNGASVANGANYAILCCPDQAGHEGKHDCTQRAHLCGMTCHLNNKLNCNQYCTRKSGHHVDIANDEHLCSSVHMCGEPCALPGCKKPCVVVYGQDHIKHACRERACPKKCHIRGCNNTCKEVDNHFHDLLDNGLPRKKKHVCNEHSSP